MFTETAFIGCENLPHAMADQFDKPWQFMGEVVPGKVNVNCLCEKCNSPKVTLARSTKPTPLVIVEMRGFRFVTDDLIKITVYFGVCNECGAVCWARSGPPFKRVRSYVFA